MRTLLFLAFQFGGLLFLFLVWLLWLQILILCWVKLLRVTILVLFLILEEKLSPFHCWIYWLWGCCIQLVLGWDMFPPYPLCSEFSFSFFFLSWINVDIHRCFFWLSWDGHMIFIPHFLNELYHIDWFTHIEPSLHHWN